MDAIEKWMIIWFTPQQITTLLKLMSSQKLFFKSSLLLIGQSPGPEPNCERVLEQRCAASAKLEVELELNERLR